MMYFYNLSIKYPYVLPPYNSGEAMIDNSVSNIVILRLAFLCCYNAHYSYTNKTLLMSLL